MVKSSGHEKSEDIEARLTSQDPEVLETCLSFVKELFTTEQERGDRVSSRATSIIGFAAIVAALSADLLNFISSMRTTKYCFSVGLALIYICMLITIFGSIWLGFGGRRRDTAAVPHVDGIFSFQGLKVIDVKRKWLSDLISAYKVTTDDVNQRVTRVHSAQNWLAVAVFLLLLLAGLGVIAILIV